MSSTANNFRKNLSKAYASTLGKASNVSGMMTDMNKYSSEMKEEKVSKSNTKAQKNIKAMVDIIKNIDDTRLRKEAADWMIKDFKKQFRDFDSNEFLKMCNVEIKKGDTKEETEKTTAKKQFAHDLQLDPDFEEFKKRAKHNVRGVTDTYGVPNVTSDDPYIKKKTKYGRPGRGKEETIEATSSGSSGAFSGPIAFKDSDFVRKSFAETPGKLKEGIATNAIGTDKVEATEATTSGSVGGYQSPSMWAKSTKKKDWGPSRKTQIPGGGFVKVKKKCTRFPYCNQGDINALKITKNESVKEAIKNVSKKIGISEKLIINILEQEYRNSKKTGK